MPDQDIARKTASILHPNVDPAALLVAVLAAGISPLVAEGAWDKINTVVAGVVLSVTLAYTWPRRATMQFDSEDRPPSTPRPDKWTAIAQSIVYGFLVAIGAAWIVQKVRFGDEDCAPYLVGPFLRACQETINNHATTASTTALFIGAVTVPFFFAGILVVTNRVIAREFVRIDSPGSSEEAEEAPEGQQAQSAAATSPPAGSSTTESRPAPVETTSSAESQPAPAVPPAPPTAPVQQPAPPQDEGGPAPTSET